MDARLCGLLGSFYWRVAVSYVLLVLGLLVVQGMMVGFVVARANAQSRVLLPNLALARTAAALGERLAADPGRPLAETLAAVATRFPSATYMVLKDGRIAGGSGEPLPYHLRRAALALLAAPDRARGATPAPVEPVPLLAAPILVRNEVVGLVVVAPPRFPSPLREIARVMMLPGTLLLPAAAAIATLVIFGPARRRLAALERAADRLGTGDLSTRAADSGRDEIARVATAFNRMAAELAERDRTIRAESDRRRRMLADVSHELKTPLTTIRGAVETLQMAAETVGDDVRARSLAMIDRESGRMARIVIDLLELARHEHGRGALDLQAFAPRCLFAHVVARHAGAADARGVRIEIHVDECADQLVGDPHLIEQAVDNLVANALRYTPDGGSVWLRAGLDGEVALLCVVDSGPGIAPEHQPHVFDRFYKADASRQAEASGSGLGLSIVKAIAERHGGAAVLESRPGRTVLAVRLPQ